MVALNNTSEMDGLFSVLLYQEIISIKKNNPGNHHKRRHNSLNFHITKSPITMTNISFPTILGHIFFSPFPKL